MPRDDFTCVSMEPSSAPAGATMAQALFLGGFFTGRALCSGLGRCGLCRVRYRGLAPEATATERRKLGPDRLGEGWRLACQHPVQAAQLLVPAGSGGGSGAAGSGPPARPMDVMAGLVLAVDVGTTGLEWEAALDGRPVAHGRDLNPQMGAGADIVSRLAFAAGDRGYLRGLLLDYLRRVIGRLPGAPESMCLAGNPAMMYIALGLDALSLARAPYRLDFAGGARVRLAGDLPEALIAPLWGPFVGGDASAGLVHLALARGGGDYPFLLADLGTNGEFLLAAGPGEFWAASAPLGPALEGSGLTHGVLAGPGCAVAFDAAPSGLAPVTFSGEDDWNGGVSGTGYLSLIATLTRFGIIARDGRFADLAASPALAGLAGRFGIAPVRGAPEAGLALSKMTLWASDVEEVLKVKAACNAVFSRVLAAAGLDPWRLVTLDLAGALGYHVRAADLEELGFIPPGLARIAVKAGNTALAGALDLLVDPRALELAAAAAARARVLDLALDPGFEREYLARMVFEYVS
ncbi:MAG: DUF4445 domain-containing protein [Desulfovibrionaceae bacterium]|nr:DUF4445 domain-containing protein [Desulfovibrionaceae bacterium]